MSPDQELYIRQNLDAYSSWGNMVLDKPPVKALLDELDRLRFEASRHQQQIADMEFSVDTIKLAYQQSEQRCAELEEVLQTARAALHHCDIRHKKCSCSREAIVEIDGLKLSQTSPKE